MNGFLLGLPIKDPFLWGVERVPSGLLLKHDTIITHSSNWNQHQHCYNHATTTPLDETESVQT